jgi:hypothetical protein
MQAQTNVANVTSSIGSAHNKLYRLAFVGGPIDGYETQSDVLPDTYFHLRSGPAGCGTKAGSGVSPRVARYKLASMRLVTLWHAPIALCRFEYCGTATASVSHRSSWWRRRLDAFWQWIEPQLSGRNGHDLRRSSVHVQD